MTPPPPAPEKCSNCCGAGYFGKPAVPVRIDGTECDLWEELATVRQCEEALEAAHVMDDRWLKAVERFRVLYDALAAPPDTEATMRDRILAVLHKYPASEFATEVYAAINEPDSVGREEK